MDLKEKSKYLEEMIPYIVEGMPVVIKSAVFVSRRMDSEATGYCHSYYIPSLGNEMEVEFYEDRDSRLLFQTIVHETHHACMSQITRLLENSDVPSSIYKKLSEINCDVSGCLASNIFHNYDKIHKLLSKILDNRKSK